MHTNSMRTRTLILSLCAGFCLLASCQSNDEAPAQEMPAVPVIAAVPVVKDVPVYIEAVGTLKPSVRLEIFPQVSGAIERVLVEEGAIVEKGTPLVIIEQAPYQIKMQEAEAQLAMNKASLESARRKLERFSTLAGKDLIAQTEWDDLETAFATAQAAIQLDEARVRGSRLDLERCTLRSPIAGRVGKLDLHPGLLIMHAQGTPQGAPIAEVVQMDPLIVEFSVTEKEYAKTAGWDQPIQLKLLCSDAICKEGRVTFLDNHFDSRTGMMLIRAKISNAEQTLRPGQSVRVQVPVSVAVQAKLIPQKAIRYNQQGAYVYVVQEDSTVALRPIVTGEEQGSDQIVLEGIEPGERIIVDGHLRLAPGTKVDLKP